jgi:hypothetical protein
MFCAGLPDGLILYQKSKFGQILMGLAIEDVGIFYGHLAHFTVLCCILWTFCIIQGSLVYFSRFGILFQEKSGNPGFVSSFGGTNRFSETLYISVFIKSYFFFLNHFFLKYTQ